MGYVTTLVLDADRSTMSSMIDQFAGSIRTGDVAVFYYAGHGMQVDGENYLIPTDFSASSSSQGRYQGYSLSELLNNIEAHGATTQIVILDACRDNPFRGMRSLHGGWAGINSSAGSFIAFGTSPGSTAADSPDKGHGAFTAALLKHLTTSKLDIDQTFELVREDVIAASGGHQVPWTASSLVGTFHLIPDLDSRGTNTSSSTQRAISLAGMKMPSSGSSEKSRTIASDPNAQQAMARVARLKALLASQQAGALKGSATASLQSGLVRPPTNISTATSPSITTSQGTALRSVTPDTEDTNGESNVATLLLNAGVDQLQTEHLEDAQRSLEALLALDPRTELAARLLSLTLGRLGRTHEAIRILDRSVSSHTPSALLLHDRCIEEASINSSQAVEDCTEALTVMPQISDGHTSLAAAYLAADSLDRAEAELQKARTANESAALDADLKTQLTAQERGLH
jgi:hypothetical protein